MSTFDIDAHGHKLAGMYVIAEIETASDPIKRNGVSWWDTRVMLDPRELPDDFVEMNRQSLQYAYLRGLIAWHPDEPHLVRIIPQKDQS
jgi:hypothetical protein